MTISYTRTYYKNISLIGIDYVKLVTLHSVICKAKKSQRYLLHDGFTDQLELF